MAFGNKCNEPVRQYSYYSKGPITEGAYLDRQMRLASDLQHEIVQLELDRRKAIREAREAAFPACQDARLAAEAAASDLFQAERDLKDANARNRARVSDAALAELVSAARARLDAARTLEKERRRQANLNDQLRLRYQQISTDYTAQKTARRAHYVADRGLFWSIGTEVLGRVPTSGDPPTHKRFDGGGSLYFQVQRPPLFSSLVPGFDARLSVADCPPGGTRRTRPDSYKLFEMYVGSSREGDAPDGTPADPLTVALVTAPPVKGRTRRGRPPGAPGRARPASAPRKKVRHVVRMELVWGRDVPDDARLRGVRLVREARNHGPYAAWRVLFVLSRPAWEEKNRAAGGAVAVVAGFRRRSPNGLRGGYWVGSDGAHGEILIPEHALACQRRHRVVRGYRDVFFAAARDRLRAWWVANRGSVSEEFSARLEYLDRWNKPERLHEFGTWWSGHRQPGDEQIYHTICGGGPGTADYVVDVPDDLNEALGGYQIGPRRGWLGLDKHFLWGLDVALRRRAYNLRDAAYTQTVLYLRDRYRVAYLTEVQWGALIENDVVEEDTDPVNKTNYSLAAPATLLDRFRPFFTAVNVNAAGTVATCCACGGATVPPGRSVRLVCSACHVVHDRARNAAQNVLQRGTLTAAAGTGTNDPDDE